MIEQSVSLASNGVVKVPGYEQLVRFGYTKNRGVYRLAVTATGEWEGLTIRCFWHVPDGKDPASSLVVDGSVDVPASVTAKPGNGCITFEGSDGNKTVTSADLRYRVSANSGTEDGTEPEPGTPAWQQLVDAVHTDATAAEQAKTDAQTAAQQAWTSASVASTSAAMAGQSAQQAADNLQELKNGIANGDFKGEKGDKGDTGPIGPVGPQGDTGPQGPKGDVGSAGEDGKDGTQIDDTTVTDSAPWSSKHIVDMLCPPISETGNPVQCYPVAEYPLGCKVRWEPTQEGSGDPSPDNVRSIKGRDNVTVERCGKNLLKFPYSTSATNRNGLVIEPQQDGSITVNGTATANTWHAINQNIEKRLPMNTPMTLSGCPAGGSAKSYYIGLYLGGKWFADTGNGNTDVKFTTREIQSRVEVSIIKGTVCNNLTFYPKIEVGTTITPYSKYQGSTATLTLPRTIYGGTVDAATGEGQETWRTTTDVVDGNKLKFTAHGEYWDLPNGTAPGIGDQLRTDVISSHFLRNFSGNKSDAKIWTTAKYMEFRFNTVDELNAYCSAQAAAGTPVQFAYKLATPTPFTATGAQPLPALAGVNTVLTDADSATLTGRADPIKRIIDLEDAVASMT